VLTVHETPTFVRSATGVWSESERHEFIDFIAENPNAGDLIVGTNSLRKVRWSRAGMGKRGGVRVIYYVQYREHEIVLLVCYAKAKFDNLPADYLNRLKGTYDA
jgi:mRNA-degrading endonuclease RelE of RelBE toxin-antitoxin system